VIPSTLEDWICIPVRSRNILYVVIDDAHAYVLVEEKIDLIIKDKLQISNFDESSTEKLVSDVCFILKHAGPVIYLTFIYFSNFFLFQSFFFFFNSWGASSQIHLDFLSPSLIHSSANICGAICIFQSEEIKIY